jgi:hypothetical protein
MDKDMEFNNVYGYFAEFVNKLTLANLKKLDNKTLQQSFNVYKTSLVNYYGISSTLINLIQKKGIYSLKINKKIIPQKQLKKSLEWLQYNGIIVEYLKKIGFSQKILESEIVKQRNFDFLKKYDNYEGFHLLTNIKIRMKLAKQVNNSIKENIKTAADLINVLNKNLWLKKQFDNYLKTYYVDDSGIMGNWEKTLATPINDINSLFDAIKNHQNSIKPGCWAIKYNKNNKCLVKDLSCNETIDPKTILCELNCKKCCTNQKNCQLVCSNTSGSVLVPSDTVLICIKSSNFWVAAQDYMSIFFDVPEIEVINDDLELDDDELNDSELNDDELNDENETDSLISDIFKWFWILIVMAVLLWMIYLIYSKGRS